jgi:succinate-acetate transporter protein
VAVPLGVAGFGFSVLMLGMADARIFTPNAVGIFVPIAMATGGLTLLVAGLYELRANNAFGGTFAVIYAGFLLTTALIIRYYGPDVAKAPGAIGFGDAFGVWLLLWAAFTALLAVGAYHINLPAFGAFAFLALAYFLLGWASVANPGSLANGLTKIGGWVLIVDGLCAWYLSWASLMNVTIGSNLPLWPHPYARPKGESEVMAPPPAITV